MRWRERRWAPVAAIGLALVAVVGSALWYFEHGEGITGQWTGPAEAPGARAGRAQASAEEVAKHAPSVEPSLAPPHAASAAVKRSVIDNQAIRKALADGDARALEAAFDDLARCAGIQEKRDRLAGMAGYPDFRDSALALERSIQEDGAFCAGADHDLVSRRSTYMRNAIATRFSPGLVNRYYMAGPLGDWREIEQRPDDPLLQAWYADVVTLLQRAALSGDVEAMHSLEHIYRNGPVAQRNPVAALAYHLADIELGLQNGRYSRNGPGVKNVNQQAAKLSAVDLQAAQAQAKELLQVCCPQIPGITALKGR